MGETRPKPNFFWHYYFLVTFQDSWVPIPPRFLLKFAESRDKEIQSLLRKKKREWLFFEKFNALKI